MKKSPGELPFEDVLKKKLSNIIAELRKDPEKNELWERIDAISKGKLRKLVKDPLKDFLKHRHRF